MGEEAFSAGESIIMVASLGFGGVYWVRWMFAVLFVQGHPRSAGMRVPLSLIPAIALAALFVALNVWASHDVRDSAGYLFFYVAFGAGWTAVGSWLVSALGISLRDDVLERANSSAAFAWTGALAGLTAAFAGANVGDGPGWWCVAFAGGLSTAGLFLAWAMLDRFGGVNHSVTVDRDAASGIRLGGFFLAAGAILGRAAAGDCTSAADTVIEFAAGWPALPLLAAAIAVERVSRPGRERPFGNVLVHGLLPALAYLLWAYAGILLVGPVPDSYTVPG